MAKFSDGFKARMVKRMAGPERISALALSHEVSIGQPTLSRWLREARMINPMKPKNNKKSERSSKRRTAEDKFRIVLEASSLSEEELGAFLRKEGLTSIQLQEWQEKVQEASTSALKDSKRKKSEQTPEAKELRKVRSELRRKEKALAEAAALLVLQKKLQDYWEEKE